MRVEMGTWVHRGLVGVLLLLALAALIGIVIPPAWTSSREILFSPARETFVRIFVDARKLVVITRAPVGSSQEVDHDWRADFAGVQVVCFDAFDASSGAELTDTRVTYFIVPLLMLLVVAMPYPVFYLVRSYRRRRRHGPGRCSQCHYELTGNVSGVCPECGLIVGGVSERRGVV